ncbi:hypothetical protein [Intrasporangium sp.]|uniref:hypothetical protein n=1 Tax=Intrasporangium sp. TaxID=1925024 RepID=UPI002B47CC81|nr:hypothetical protein [Intrasporangium sp.]
MVGEVVGRGEVGVVVGSDVLVLGSVLGSVVGDVDVEVGATVAVAPGVAGDLPHPARATRATARTPIHIRIARRPLASMAPPVLESLTSSAALLVW